MMEILKANTVNLNKHMIHATDRNWDSLIISDVNDIYDEPPKSKFQKRLDRDYPVLNPNDFDTCDRAYSNNTSDNLQGYYSQYNTYLDQFENC